MALLRTWDGREVWQVRWAFPVILFSWLAEQCLTHLLGHYRS